MKIKLRQDEIPDEQLAKLACEYDLGPIPIRMGKYRWWEQFPLEARESHVYVKNVGHPYGGEPRFAILCDGRDCLNKEGVWEYQVSPSNRSDDFYERCRFASLQEAINFYNDWKQALCEWAEKELQDRGNIVLNIEAFEQLLVQ
jgi:hypothetical protein